MYLAVPNRQYMHPFVSKLLDIRPKKKDSLIAEHPTIL
jgi:hypothetical protein